MAAQWQKAAMIRVDVIVTPLRLPPRAFHIALPWQCILSFSTRCFHTLFFIFAVCAFCNCARDVPDG